LTSSPFWDRWPDINFFEWQFFSSSCKVPTVTRGWVCNLQCNNVLVSPTRTITIYYCLIWDSPNLVKVKVTLQLTVSQSLCQGIEPILGHVTRYYFLSEGCFLKFAVLSLWSGLSMRGRVCHLSFSVYSNLLVFTSSICVTCVLQFSNLYTIYTKLHSLPPESSRLCSTSYF
jgi:hypothetical protein